MTIGFLTQPPATTATPSSDTTFVPLPQRETVKTILIGSPAGVTHTIHKLHRLGFAPASDWSPLQPSTQPGEVVSILIRRFVLR
ncbi:peptide ABC transporter substrate-binding protein [Oscillatoria sp. FACHB-1406]|uniref:peptide ABC transporter substrate-binding protein n=1 Tax=Oscillatoria sp. FACHB-1406 TaxID=2692846 RepID=UPI001684FAC6|nr:peptide ABC transporter substrate-binding protein [Oscillatoria sp. FACHB-1406]MBD2576577.1 peptide ABC transporter substrate-binding protein [Oscillatoria sp. FACHB-1406]